MAEEFDLIQHWFTRTSRREDIRVGIGDDAAVLHPPQQQDLVLAVDTLIEGVHFPLSTPPEAIGYKSLAVNLSDLAAMGADPAWATLALSLPTADEAWLADFSKGFFGLAEQYDVALVGGDTTRGNLTITVQVCGHLPINQALRRSAAEPGDGIYVTGTLGDAGLALEWLSGKRNLSDTEADFVLTRLNWPTPRIEAGRALRGIAHAAIDISDGLLADLMHILSASGMGADLQAQSIPLSETVRKQAGGLLLALSAGDDYELVFTLPESTEADMLCQMADIGVSVTQIGQISAHPGLRIFDGAGQPMPIARTGYNHFSGAI